MSGGSYDYFYLKLEEFANNMREREPNEARKDFIELVDDMVKIAQAVEWADSGDISQEDANRALGQFFFKWRNSYGES